MNPLLRSWITDTFKFSVTIGYVTGWILIYSVFPILAVLGGK